jgi:hypothetical protein
MSSGGGRGTLPSIECSERTRKHALSSTDPFGARAPLGPGLPDIYRLDVLGDRTGGVDLPVTIRILLENALRHAREDGVISPEDVELSPHGA